MADVECIVNLQPSLQLGSGEKKQEIPPPPKKKKLKINTTCASYFTRVFFLTIIHRVHSNYDMRALETIYIMSNQPFLCKFKERLSKYNLFVIDTADSLVVSFFHFLIILHMLIYFVLDWL